MKLSRFKSLAYMILFLALAACSTEPKVNELPSSSDPQVELNRINENLRQAQDKQVDILSPTNFERAEKARDKAIEARNKNKEQAKILHHIAVSQAYIDQATATANVGEQILEKPLQARKAALAANANANYSKEMRKADSEMQDLTRKIEDKNTNISEKKRDEVAKMYQDLQLKSVKKEKLGVAQANLEQAKKEGAKKLTPETLSATEKQIANDEAVIANNLGNSELVNQASTRATVASERLLRMVRTAKTADATNPEELAKQVERNEREAAQSEKMLDQTERELARAKDRLTSQSERTKALESEVWLDREYSAAMNKFSNDEAEVYKQGNKLLLRLKGLSFANGKAELTDKNFALLNKVKKVIGDVDASQVVIEGHTDSVGAKEINTALSEKRAKAVEAYLTADEGIDAAKITTEGFGDTKPIATNKTDAGRSQNRRVDVVISAEPITE